MNQIELLTRIKKYFKSSKTNSNNQKFYLSSFSATPGYAVLKKIEKNNLGLLIKNKIYFFHFLASLKLTNTKIFYKKITNDFDSIILTWGSIKNFKKDGSFNDKYFNQNSRKNKNFLWFIISLDSKRPNKIDDNIVIFFQNNFSYLNFILFLLEIPKKLLLRVVGLNEKISFYYLENLSIKIWNRLEKFTKTKKLKKIIMPYEAQPFQNYIFEKIKNYNKNIVTIGYVHSTQPLPSHLFKRQGAPDKLYVHGNDQKYHCKKYLGWTKNQIKLSPSFRFLKKDKNNFKNKVFLPYDFSDSKFILQLFENLVNHNSELINNNMEILLHPHTKQSKKHQTLKVEMLKILKSNKSNRKYNKKISTIIIGDSSAVLEVLENKLKPYHICENQLSMCSKHIWPSIEVTKIFDNCYRYKLKKLNSCINYKKNNKSLNFFK